MCRFLKRLFIRWCAEEWGGQTVTVPRSTWKQLAARDAEVYRHFDGANHIELAKRYHLSVRAIHDIIKRHSAERQETHSATDADICRGFYGESERLLARRLGLPVDDIYAAIARTEARVVKLYNLGMTDFQIAWDMQIPLKAVNAILTQRLGASSVFAWQLPRQPQ